MTTNHTTVDSQLAQAQLGLAELHLDPTTLDSLPAEFHFNCTYRSRPPSGMATTRSSYYAAIENSSDPEHVKLYSRLQDLLMSRESVLWHVLKTLEDSEFWTREIVGMSQSSAGVGLSSASGKRLIRWGKGLYSVADRTHGGTVTGYSALWSEAGGELDIRRPGRVKVLFKRIAEQPNYPLGRELIRQFENEVERLEATTDNIADVVRWFKAPSPNGQGNSGGTFN